MKLEEFFISLDIGLTNIKMAFFNEYGIIKYSYEKKCDLNYFTEDELIDSEVWWNAVLSLLNSIPAEIRRQVKSICVIGQGPTIVPIGRQGGRVYPAIPWLEKKGNGNIGYYMSKGYDGQTATVLSKLKHFSEKFRENLYLLLPYDYIVYKLTGILCNCTYEKDGYMPWNDEILFETGLSVKYKTPPVIEPGKVVGAIDKNSSAITFLPEECLVISGAPDFVAGLIGTGVIFDGMVCDRGGTSQGVTLCSNFKKNIDGLITKPFMFGESWKISGVMNTSGKSLDWFCNSVLKTNTSDYFSKVEGDMRDYQIKSNLIFLPYLNGERSPHWDDNLRGVFFGLDTNDDWYSMGLAIMQGVCFSIKDIVDRMKDGGCSLRTFRETGKQSLSRLWNQMKADIIGTEIEVTEIRESELLGAAIWSISIMKGIEMKKLVSDIVRIEETFFPRTEYECNYKRLFELYRELHGRTKSLFKKMNSATV